jgi:hypothetical protein
MHERLAFIAASLLAGAAAAQMSSSGKSAPEHVRGDIVAIDGNTVKDFCQKGGRFGPHNINHHHHSPFLGS